MSVEAITWALAQQLDRSSTKFVLVAMANCADGLTMSCFPSIDYLREATCQDRKTVLENIKRLIELGIISDSGERKGRTNQITVYRLNKEYQKRNSPENGTVPKTETKSPVFPAKESRFSAETVPKTGHGTVKEPSVEPSGNRKERTALPSRPDDVTEKTWRDWCALRKAKRATVSETVVDGARQEAGKAGLTLERFLAVWCMRGSQGLLADWLKPNERGPTRTPPAADAERRAAKTAEAKRLLFGTQQEIIDA